MLAAVLRFRATTTLAPMRMLLLATLASIQCVACKQLQSQPLRTSMAPVACARRAACAIGIMGGAFTSFLGAPQRCIAIPPIPENAYASKPEQLDVPQVLYTPPAVKGFSSPEALALAKHLKTQGAKMYGAYWCSHCFNQKNMFGAGGSRIIEYVECAEDGYQSQRMLCKAKEIRGYPTWEINGKFFPGERSLEELGTLSGFTSTVAEASGNGRSE